MNARRVLVGLLALMLVWLQARLWIGDGGMRGVHALRAAVAEQAAENQRLRERNQALMADVDDLRHGQDAAEGRARNMLGMVRPGEVFYQVIGDARAGAESDSP